MYSSMDKTDMEQHAISQWFCLGQVQFKPGYFLSDAVWHTAYAATTAAQVKT